MSKRKLAKNIGSMSLAVFISRIFGLARDMISTAFFGTSYVADAFRIAFQIPNLLRRLFGEGALSAAFVPIYSEIGINKGKKEQINFALNVLSILSLFLLLLCCFGILLTPIIVKLIAPGLDNVTTLLVIKLTRILFPYLFLIGMSSTLISILNSHDYFFIPGLSSAFLNIAMIGSLGIYLLLKTDASMEDNIHIWSLGVILGGVLQTIVNLPLLRRIGYRVRTNFSFRSDALQAVWKRLIPGAIGIAVRQINLIADTILASLLVSGSIAALGYGNRLMQLPMGIFGIAAGVAVLPLFSRLVAEKKWLELQDNLKFSIISLAYIMLPITAIIAGIGRDLIRILFLRGRFDLTSLEMTYQALLFYSLGIIFYSLNRLVIPVFYANKDTKTPVKISAIIVVVNVMLNIILMRYMQHAGLAFATSISAALQYFVLRNSLLKRYSEVQFPKVTKPLIKIAFLSVIIFGLLSFVNLKFTAESFLTATYKIIIASTLSLVIMLIGSRVLKIEYSENIQNRLWQKFRKR
jgi:putative peptidoglycan lipid II flippase